MMNKALISSVLVSAVVATGGQRGGAGVGGYYTSQPQYYNTQPTGRFYGGGSAGFVGGSAGFAQPGVLPTVISGQPQFLEQPQFQQQPLSVGQQPQFFAAPRAVNPGVFAQQVPQVFTGVGAQVLTLEDIEVGGGGGAINGGEIIEVGGGGVVQGGGEEIVQVVQVVNGGGGGLPQLPAGPGGPGPLGGGGHGGHGGKHQKHGQVVAQPLQYITETREERVFREPISQTVTELPATINRVRKNVVQHFPMVHQQIQPHVTIEDEAVTNVVHHYYEPVDKYLGVQQGQNFVTETHVDHPDQMYVEGAEMVQEVVEVAPTVYENVVEHVNHAGLDSEVMAAAEQAVRPYTSASQSVNGNGLNGGSNFEYQTVTPNYAATAASTKFSSPLSSFSSPYGSNANNAYGYNGGY